MPVPERLSDAPVEVQQARKRIYDRYMKPAREQQEVIITTAAGPARIIADSMVRGTPRNHFYSVQLVNSGMVIVEGDSKFISHVLLLLPA